MKGAANDPNTIEGMLSEFKLGFLYTTNKPVDELIKHSPAVLERNKHIEYLRRN
ncbi:hypothetical protein NEAUS04_0107 [Nematocida ausubeli]|uniref:Uncharacterized protein n=1 Tax=Nematocida ausubeli (strain ATCC PRA-371 / ERTm2) TaxID=1913371 RepID=H8Z9I3_NEMA1|nr:uncharacterized protein NESG_00842 [Nematocida ausubeli]EHY66614.1 hypothetical protein NERG_00254 [Nematocida ausubeli]KAI5133730.1 hypothetical protein NEAUS06_0702 [Nematocida ausubeli]KAI5137109.1 hypothetical protein NEAUS07_1824 [Nematocida ausubeli]KAI5149680.1 hypothetical protein NEAUS05_1857 [Nematocida ausubeli]KAI5160733.1 hypothetical protein NEAUS04_0107 [Nematocida ausubeli]